MFIHRILDLPQLLEKKSFFLLGPRSTGKSFLIREQLSDKALVIDLLDNETYLQLSAHPSLSSIIDAQKPQYVVIDEIQKIPLLLNEVHRLIETKGIRFLLTGSSARKLRAKDTNLLAGRAWLAAMFPLTSHEIPDFDLDQHLLYGGLPQVYLSQQPREELSAYVDVYLRDEIQSESFVRKLNSFNRFLQTAALTNGTMINFSSLASDVSIPASTVREYYTLLEDTLLGFKVPAWTKTAKRKAVSTSKFYFFDLGVKNYLCGIQSIEKSTDLYGRNFEHFIATELRSFISYTRLHTTLSYWQSRNGQKVDFIIGDDIAIEVKTVKNVSHKHLKGLKALQEENICKQYYLVCFDPIHKEIDGIQVIHWKAFLDMLWNRKIL